MAFALQARADNKKVLDLPVKNLPLDRAYANNHSNGNREPLISFLTGSSNVQVYRSQSQRTGHFLKGPFTYVSKFSPYLNSLIHIFESTSEGYVRSCRLILFPFHVFW